jgi:serine/threonine protein kinase
LNLIDSFQNLHSIGYVHNDIKPDNMLLETGDITKISSSQVVLIDFGVARRFMDNGKHIKEESNVNFTGNIIFGSKNAFQEKSLSRRDDLISLLYLLVYFFNGKIKMIQGVNSGASIFS